MINTVLSWFGYRLTKATPETVAFYEFMRRVDVRLDAMDREGPFLFGGRLDAAVEIGKLRNELVDALYDDFAGGETLSSSIAIDAAAERLAAASAVIARQFGDL